MESELLFQRIDAEREEAVARGRAFFDCPELGFQETETARKICALLDGWGVPYHAGVALTGVVATIGSGGYHVAVAADMDALPRKDGQGNLHACGHSIQVANALTVLHALVPEARQGTLGGRVSFFFTPAEELTDMEGRAALIASGKLLGRSGKQDMIARGWFDDVDCVLSCHANADPGRGFDVDSVLTGFLLKRAVFHGRAAHSGAAPHLGRNALHGAVLAETALGLLKDQFAPDNCVRIQPVIGGVTGGINVIPDTAALETYVRAVSREALLDAAGRFDACVGGCAAALGLSAELSTAPGYLPLNQSPILNRAVEKNMLRFVSPEQITHRPVSGASGDVGDLGTLLPTVQFGFSGIDGAFHSDTFSVRDEEHCYLTAAKVLAGTVADLLSRPEYQVKSERYHEEKRRYLSDWLGLSEKG
jgi:amidohydrolase